MAQAAPGRRHAVGRDARVGATAGLLGCCGGNLPRTLQTRCRTTGLQRHRRRRWRPPSPPSGQDRNYHFPGPCRVLRANRGSTRRPRLAAMTILAAAARRAFRIPSSPPRSIAFLQNVRRFDGSASASPSCETPMSLTVAAVGLVATAIRTPCAIRLPPGKTHRRRHNLRCGIAQSL